MELIDVDRPAARTWPKQDTSYPWPSTSLLQTVPSGKTSKNVASSLFTAADVAFIERHPLRDDAARIQALLAQLEVLARVERRRAFDPRMDRVGRDDVEFFPRREDVVPRVVIDDLDPLCP